MRAKEKNKPNFSQHLLLMGDRFDAQVTRWFKGAVVIEHDLKSKSGKHEFKEIGFLCGDTFGYKITKVTEVIGGLDKGVTLAKISGSFPLVMTCRTEEERDVQAQALELSRRIELLKDARAANFECLFGVVNCTRGAVGKSNEGLKKSAQDMWQQHLAMEDAIQNVIKVNLRSLLI